MRPLYIILGAVDLLLIGLSITFGKILDKSWLFWFGFIWIGVTILLILLVVLIRTLSHNEEKPQHKKMDFTQELPKGLEKSTLKQIALRLLMTEKAEMIEECSERLMNVGMQGTQKSKVYMLYGRGYYTNKIWYFLMNVETKEYCIESRPDSEMGIISSHIQDMINKLAENPEVKDVVEESISLDDFGNPVRNRKTTSMTRKEMEQKKEEKKKEEEEGLG